MKTDLKYMSRKELEKLSADIDKAMAKLANREKALAVVAVEKIAKAHGFTLAELGDSKPSVKLASKPRKKQKQASAPKFVNLDDNAKTWTGKGRQPDWFKQALAAGKTPDEMAI
ncbi:H-NS histone family protein [Octadecabacter antarcticus]|nr:H-NS histone family protein [Octadecabacter antarcticus]